MGMIIKAHKCSALLVYVIYSFNLHSHPIIYYLYFLGKEIEECLSNLPKSPELLGSEAKDLYLVRLPRGLCS